MEFCKYGDLLSFLHRYRKHYVNQIDPLTDVINYDILSVTQNNAMSPLSPGARYVHPLQQLIGIQPPYNFDVKIKIRMIKRNSHEINYSLYIEIKVMECGRN